MVFMFKVTVTLTFELLTPKPIGIIYESWLFMIQRTFNLVCEIILKFMSGHDFVYAGQTDGRTDGRHNIIRPKVPSGV